MSRNTPNAEHRFFLYDPEGYGFSFYKTVEERDSAAKESIDAYLDDGWSEEVTSVLVGEVTGHTVMRIGEVRPERGDFDNDEDFDDAMSEYGNPEWDYKCRYELAPLTDKGDSAPERKSASPPSEKGGASAV